MVHGGCCGRFEKLDITPKSAQKIKPVLERWMAEAEERYKNGMQNLTEFIGSEPSKKRKRRTSFTPQALEVLNEYFERNTHPSGQQHTHTLTIALSHTHTHTSCQYIINHVATRATLCQHGICCCPVSVCLSVCHKPVLCPNS